jgi:ribosomal protein S18 acetylase RimI-like enzyme
VELRWLGPDDVEAVASAAHLFDDKPRRKWTAEFLTRDNHHLGIAYVDGEPAGFVTGVELIHPDKATEMLLYELGVDEAFRRRGVGNALTRGLAAVARARGCREMWTLTEPDNDPALATYRSAGAEGRSDAVVLTWRLTDTPT